jgi:2-polyprenyl-6-methoxyphenol hydroxylase-like FAD-dependent oxidoreductase
MTEHVLVIGGGIVGSSAAYLLACRGVWVTRLDHAAQLPEPVPMGPPPRTWPAETHCPWT